MLGEALQRLVKLAKQEMSSETPSIAMSNLVEMLLRSRKVGRAPLGQPLAGVYQDINNRLQLELETTLKQELEYGDQNDLRSWANSLLQKATQNILTDDVLKALALEAQCHPPQSTLRRHALVQLVEAIQLSRRLARPHQGKFPLQLYEMLYEEAVNQTLAYVCHRIDTYDPERGQSQKFMNWVNFRLDRMVIECRRQFSDRNTQNLPNLNDLEALPYPEKTPSPAADLQDFIVADSDQVFQSTHIRNCPEANFRTIALARLNNESWEEISEELSIKIPTLSSFFQRCCVKFASKFEELL